MKNTLLLLLAIQLSVIVLSAQEKPFQVTHRGSILHIKFSPDGSKLVSYSSGNQDICLWDVQSGRLIWTRPISFIQKADEYYTLNTLAWSPDQSRIATGSGNGSVQLWDATSGEFLWLTEVAKNGISAVAFSPDGKTLAATPYSDETYSAKLLEVGTGRSTASLPGNTCAHVSLAFDPDGATLKIGNLNGGVSTWNISSGLSADREPVNCKSMYSYGGERVFSEDLSLSVRRTTADKLVIEESAGKLIKEIKVNHSKMAAVVNARVKLAIISEYGGFHLYNLENGEDRVIDHSAGGNTFDLSINGKLFAQEDRVYSTAIRITDLANGKSWSLDGHPSYIHAISYSPNYRILAVAGNDGRIYFFDPLTKNLLKTLDGHNTRVTAIAFSPDGHKLLSGDGDGVLKTWDVSTGENLKEVKANDREDEIETLAFSKNGKKFLSLINKEVLLWDAASLTPQGKLNIPEGYESTSGNMVLTSSNVPINSAAFSIDGQSVITGHPDGTIRVWDVNNRQQVRKFNVGKSVQFAMPSPDGKNAVAVINTETANKFELIGLLKGNILKSSRNIDFSYPEKASISPNGKLATVTGNIGDTTIWNLEDLSLRDLGYELSGGDTVAFSSDSKTFFIGGENQNLYLYDTLSGKRRWQLLPDFQPSRTEINLEAEKNVRIDVLAKKKANRENLAARYVRNFRKKVYVTFEHYGDMSDPGEKRMVESDEVKESKTMISATESNAVWLRLHNDSTLPIEVPTESMYLRDTQCFFEFPNKEKVYGLCKDREIGVWYGIKDNQGKWIPYGFDFGSSVILLPNSSVIFPVPVSIWNKNYFVVFDYSFQNTRASENDRKMDYGTKIELKVNKQSLLIK